MIYGRHTEYIVCVFFVARYGTVFAARKTVELKTMEAK
jgi:hypothetical protein